VLYTDKGGDSRTAAVHITLSYINIIYKLILTWHKLPYEMRMTTIEPVSLIFK